jgi:hypothetical protein
MAEERKKLEKFITPKGVAVFPWLNRPDTKFNPLGEYRIKLRLSGDEAAPLIEKLQKLHDKAVAQAKANPKKKGKKVKVNDFYSNVVDDNGDETGEVELSFKMKASGTSKDGNAWTRRPDLFDAKGKPLNPEAKVFGGSLCKVNFEVLPYDEAIGVGLSLRLQAVQVIKLVSSNRDAGSYGFGDESEDDDADESYEDNDESDDDEDEDSDEDGDSEDGDEDEDDF